MKRILLSCALFFVLGLASNLYAQSCYVGTPNISNVSIYSQGDSCYAKFDLSFTMKLNSGNKYIGIDFWQSVNYVRPEYSKVPTAKELQNSLGSISIDNDKNVSSITPNTVYPFATGVRILRSGSITKTVTADSVNYFIPGIIVAVKKSTDGTCPVSLLSIRADVYSTNSGNGGANNQIQCVNGITFSLGNPTISSALRNCTKPRTLDFKIETSSLTNITVSYKIYKDVGTGTPTFDPNVDQNVTINNEVTVTNLSSTNPIVGDKVSFTGADGNYSLDENAKYWVVVYYTPPVAPGEQPLTYSVSRLINNTCMAEGALPVHFKSVSATRKGEKVTIKWETATETNNRGFNVQRNDKGVWKNIAFAFSQANDGNSSSALAYQFTDLNTSKALSQYRVQQVDMDGKASYSRICTVNAEVSTRSVIVYPNPSADGKVNLLFEDNSERNVIISDMSGRIVKQYKSITNNELSVSLLQSGMYTIQITNLAKATITTEKLVVKKQ